MKITFSSTIPDIPQKVWAWGGCCFRQTLHWTKNKLAIIYRGANQGGFAEILHEQGQNIYTTLWKGLSTFARFSWRLEQMLPNQTWEKKAIYTEDKDGWLRNVIFSNEPLLFLYWWLKFSFLVIVTHVPLFAGGCQVLSEHSQNSTCMLL